MIEEMPQGKPKKSAWDKTLDFLNRRALNRRQLTGKLRVAGYDWSEIRLAVEKAEKLGFVNDELLAGDYARSLTAQGKGSYAIRRKLQQKEFDSHTITQTLAYAVDEEAQTEGLRRAFEAKLRTLTREPDPRKKREKMFRHLIGRGFSPDQIRPLLDELR